jgi:glycine/D-amino acid oxidase-like deaminating enzyme
VNDAVVIGGGVQGCCAALALADLGLRVTLLEGGGTLFNEESVANVGRIHLGFHYACDPSLATARHVQMGALAFEPLIGKWIGPELSAELRWSRDYWCFIVPQSLVSFDDYLSYSKSLRATFAESLSTSPFADESGINPQLFRTRHPSTMVLRQSSLVRSVSTQAVHPHR